MTFAPPEIRRRFFFSPKAKKQIDKLCYIKYNIDNESVEIRKYKHKKEAYYEKHETHCPHPFRTCCDT